MVEWTNHQSGSITQRDRVRDFYASFWRELPPSSIERGGQLFLENVDLPPAFFAGKRCLDVGSGAGLATQKMVELGADVLAVDLDTPSLRVVRQRIRAASCAVEIAKASALSLPLASERFDFVHCNGVLHHTEDPHRGFLELVRVTRPGGTLFISLYGKGGLYGATVGVARRLSWLVPASVTGRSLKLALGHAPAPGALMPAWVSVLDNVYTPIRASFRERAVREWFREAGFPSREVVRTRAALYDHRTLATRVVHGEGFLQFRARKP